MKKLRSKLLIIEDELKNVDILSNVLVNEHFEVTYSTNNLEVQSLLQNQPFDLVLLDTKTEAIDGFQLCREIRSNKKTKEIPVIFLTELDKTEINETFRSGGDDYIIKPFNMKELIEKIETRLILKRNKEAIHQKSMQSCDSLKMLSEEVDRMKREINNLKEKNNRLQKSTREFADLEKLKNSFLRVICSELKTPVSGILGFTEILNEDPGGGENKDIIETILFASKNLKEYADTALLITQIEPEQINDNMRPTKLSSLVDYALSETMHEFSKKEIEISSNLGDELTEIIIEPGLIKDVIQIILSDAATNSPSKGAITINLTESTHKIALEISDQGRGFSDEKLRNIQDFLQQDVHSLRSEWAGMHFAIIKFIMHIHQAQVQVENCKNGGSLVRLIFPVNLSKGKILHQALSQLN